MKNHESPKFISTQEKLSQIICYTLKLEELCNKLQKQNDELNNELNTIKKECELQKEQINKLNQ